MADHGRPKPSFFAKMVLMFLGFCAGIGASYAATHWEHPQNPFAKQDMTGDTQKAVEKVADQLGITDNDVGAIMFVCNDESHGDREVVIKSCPGCSKTKNFFGHPQKKATFFCLQCDAKFPTGKIVCDECGGTPANPVRLKR